MYIQFFWGVLFFNSEINSSLKNGLSRYLPGLCFATYFWILETLKVLSTKNRWVMMQKNISDCKFEQTSNVLFCYKFYLKFKYQPITKMCFGKYCICSKYRQNIMRKFLFFTFFRQFLNAVSFYLIGFSALKFPFTATEYAMIIVKAVF